jgi:hypothetical protein
MSCGCGSTTKNCNCDVINTGDLIFDGLAFECLDDLQQELFSIPTVEPFNNVLQTIFTQICAALNQVQAGGDEAARWYVAAGDPNDNDGEDGDMYLNSLDGGVSQKASGTWSLQANIKGVSGTDGANGQSFRYGTGDPAPTLGDNGDTYVNLATPQVDIWTKAASVWTNSGIKLRGDAGTNGTDGADGADGTNGTDGTDGLNFIQSAGVPDIATGNNGDSYLDSSNGDLYLKSGGVWNITGNIYTAPIGLDFLFNAAKLSEQSLVGQNEAVQLAFSDDVSAGRFDYGNSWITDTFKSPSANDNVSFRGIINLKVTGVDGVSDNDVDVVLVKNGVDNQTLTMPIPAGTLDDTIIPFSFIFNAQFVAAADIFRLEIRTPNDVAYATFVGVSQIGDIFYNVQL